MGMRQLKEPVIAPFNSKPKQFSLPLYLALPLALLVGLVLLGLAYQVQPYVFRLDIGNSSDDTYIAQFYQAERNPEFDYRWTHRESFVNLYNPGTPYTLSFRAVTARPDNQPTEVSVVANGQELGQLKISGGAPQVYTVAGKNIIWGGEELALSLRSANPFAEKGGRGDLGFALDWIEVRSAKTGFGLTLPPPFVLGWWLLVASFPLWLTRRLGLSRWAGWAMMAATFGLVVLLYLLPESARYLHSDWLLVGLQIGLGQIGLCIGLELLGLAKNSKLIIARRWFGPAALLFCALSLLYLATARGRMSYGDDIAMEAVTANIYAGQPTANLSWLSPDDPTAPPHSKYGLGQSLVAVPFYALGDKFAKALPFMLSQRAGERGLLTYVVLFTDVLETAATALALYWLVRLLGYGRGVAFGLGGLFGLGTMAWHYARTFFSEPLVMLCLTLAVGAGLAYGQDRRLRWVWLSGFMLGLAVAARTFNLVVLPFFGLYLLWLWWQTDRRLAAALKLTLAWGLPIAGWLFLIGWWNWARFGSPFENGYGSELQLFTTPLLKGLYGQLFSPGKSLFLYNPVLLLAIAGLPALWRRKYGPGLLLLIGGVSLSYLLLYSAWYDWFGGGVWGPRFLLPLLPLLLLPAAPVLQMLADLGQPQFRRPAAYLLAGLVALTVAFSFVVQLISIIINYQIYVAVYGREPQAFWQAIFNPVASPLWVQFGQWQAGERPDFAPRFYHDTPFARFTATFQSAAWLLFVAVLLLAVSYQSSVISRQLEAIKGWWVTIWRKPPSL